MSTESITVISVPDLRGVVAKETSRYSLRGPQLRTAKDGRTIATATNGRVLMSAVVESTGPKLAKPIIAEGVKYASGGALVTVNGSISSQTVGANGKPSPARVDVEDAAANGCSFPPCADVVSADRDRAWFSVSAEFLYNVAKAVAAGSDTGHPVVTIGIEPGHPNKPIVMFATNEASRDKHHAVGVVMPVNREMTEDQCASTFGECYKATLRAE